MGADSGEVITKPKKDLFARLQKLQEHLSQEVDIFPSPIPPLDAKEGYLQELETLLSHPKMVACGEMGLDFFRNISEPATQKKVFREQLDLAEKLKKPVIFHNRNADEDIINILSEKRDIKGVSHCFSSTLETANIFITLGFYISF